MRRRTSQGLARREQARGQKAARLACWGCLLLCVLVLSGGCKRARRSTEHADVSGKVTYNGRPVTGGKVTFVTADGFSSGGVIDESGNYTINAPVGDVKIAVDNRMLMRGAGGPATARRGAGRRPDAPEATPIKGTYVHIPAKYASAEDSGLTYTVTKGPQTHNIDMKD